MALDADALANYTRGRLDPEDQETERILAASLAEVRRYCGWHVSPATGSEVALDGPGELLLRLPTLYVEELTEVTEDGVDVPVADLEVSRLGLVRKKSGQYWTAKFGGITVSMTHGFDDAPDFEAAVLSVADRRSQAPSGGIAVSVGPFRWSEDKTTGSFSGSELAILEQYRLERTA